MTIKEKSKELATTIIGGVKVYNPETAIACEKMAAWMKANPDAENVQINSYITYLEERLIITDKKLK